MPSPVWGIPVNEIALTDSAWVDVIAPVAPATFAAQTVLWMVALVVLLAAIAVAAWWRMPRQRARRAIRRLPKRIMASEAERKAACRELAQCLCVLHRAARVERIAVAPQHRERWQAFAARLAACRYGTRAPGDDEPAALAREALGYPRRDPPGRT